MEFDIFSNILITNPCFAGGDVMLPKNEKMPSFK
jgi:hypothetical protein